MKMDAGGRNLFYAVQNACTALLLASLAVVGGLAPAHATNEALLLIEADSGKVLRAENAAHPWYPASITKLMTAYVTLRAIKEGRLSLDRLLTVSPNAVAQQPTKMGFPSGTQVTVDNALKMMLVRSANDMAVVLAEGVAGSVESFAGEMNQAAARLGMVQSNWVNPNGLPDEGQVTSARDMAILARQILTEFPEYDAYWNIQAIRFGRRIIRNTNSLIVRYPGADGMKTGFICASGFNVVATATRGNRRLIAVVLGAPSPAVRAAQAAYMFETGFNNNNLNWSRVESLQPISAAPPDLHDEVCGRHRKRPPAESADDDENLVGNNLEVPASFMALFSNGPRPGIKPSALLEGGVALMPPVNVYTGPPRPQRDSSPAAAAAAGAAPASPALATRAKGSGKNDLVALPGRNGSVALPLRTKSEAAKPARPAKPAHAAKPVKPAKPPQADKSKATTKSASPAATGQVAPAKPVAKKPKTTPNGATPNAKLNSSQSAATAKPAAQ